MFAAGPRKEERRHGESRGSVDGVDYYWIGNTSRDQYIGVFFGLSVAYDHLPEDRTIIRDIGTRLLDRVLADGWSVFNTSFLLRPDQQLALLQIGRQINPERFRAPYEELRRIAIGIGLPISLEAFDEHESYFKFNLDAIALYSLLRLEEESPRRSDYIATYRTFRSIIADHGNAFFNVIDRAVIGPNAQRDAETVRLMAQWLERPRRDLYVDLRGKYEACGSDRACDPIPVAERVRTDFLWQRSPYLLFGGGSGRIETPGIDFILPYWMGRYYGMDFTPRAVSAASGLGSLAAQFDRLAIRNRDAQSRRRDQHYGQRWNHATGRRIVCKRRADQFRCAGWPGAGSGSNCGQKWLRFADNTATGEVQRVAPGLFTANASGRGVAAATAFHIESDGSQTSIPVFRCNAQLACAAERLEIEQGRPIYLSLYATGVRGGSSFRVSIGGTNAPVLFAGPQGQFAGLDQINVQLPSSLSGKGESDLVLFVDGLASNAVRIGIA